MMRLPVSAACLLIIACGGAAQQRPSQRATTPAGARTITIVTEAKAIIWIDEVRRGSTNESGALSALKLSPGVHNLRVRAAGFKEVSLPILATQRGQIPVRLVRTTDQAELLFQKAEDARESAKDDVSRQSAADLYRQALKFRPAYPAAHVGLARVLSDLNDTNGALAEM